MCSQTINRLWDGVVLDSRCYDPPMGLELQTARLVLISTPLEVIKTRLEQANFSALVPVAGSSLLIRFPHEWPGDALAIFPIMLNHLQSNPAEPEWGGIMIERTSCTAIGQIGCKGPPNSSGEVEIGYGINPAFQGRGYASELVTVFAAWLLERKSVTRVRAETVMDNLASQRVLEKSGFVRTGTRDDPGDGMLMLWQRTAV
jgi:[ribosomal protein S5]-alanine N-acetyltransferase